MPALQEVTYDNLRQVYIIFALRRLFTAHENHAVLLNNISDMMQLKLRPTGQDDVDSYNDTTLTLTKIPAIKTAGEFELKQVNIIDMKFRDGSNYSTAEASIDADFYTGFLDSLDPTKKTGLQALADVWDYIQSDITDSVAAYAADSTAPTGWFLYSIREYRYIKEIVTLTTETLREMMNEWTRLDMALANLPTSFHLRANLTLLRAAITASIQKSEAVVYQIERLIISLETNTFVTDAGLTTLSTKFSDLMNATTEVNSKIKAIYKGNADSLLGVAPITPTDGTGPTGSA